MDNNKPTLGRGYPELNITDSTYHHAISGTLGLKDAKVFFEAWEAFCTPNVRNRIEVIKLIRYVYAVAFSEATKNNNDKKYTAEQMHAAYIRGLVDGKEMLKAYTIEMYADMGKVIADKWADKNSATKDEMFSAAEELSTFNHDEYTKCNCPNCRARNNKNSGLAEVIRVIPNDEKKYI